MCMDRLAARDPSTEAPRAGACNGWLRACVSAPRRVRRCRRAGGSGTQLAPPAPQNRSTNSSDIVHVASENMSARDRTKIIWSCLESKKDDEHPQCRLCARRLAALARVFGAACDPATGRRCLVATHAIRSTNFDCRMVRMLLRRRGSADGTGLRADRAARTRRGQPASSGTSQLSLQSVLDHVHEPTLAPDWNPCHGGFPLHVLRCMEDRTCPLVYRPAAAVDEYRGYARATLDVAPSRSTAAFTVSHARRIDPREAARELHAHGPPARGECQHPQSIDARGIVTDLQPLPSNHAVCVVGWKRIVRRAVGSGRIRWARSTCRPTCRTTTARARRGRGQQLRAAREELRGTPDDPGFCLLPSAFAPLHRTDPSPWIAATVDWQSDHA